VWKVFKVSGHSMNPTIVDGDYVLAEKFRKRPLNGAIAIVQHPYFGRLIKRITISKNADEIYLMGDNKLSTTTEELGPLDEEFIQYQALWRISQTGITKLIPTRVDIN
jgi:phage repressor protein C with HTH and peptisase S24 domain